MKIEGRGEINPSSAKKRLFEVEGFASRFDFYQNMGKGQIDPPLCITCSYGPYIDIFTSKTWNAIDLLSKA